MWRSRRSKPYRMTQIYIEAGHCKKVNRVLMLAVPAGNDPNRCRKCTYNRVKIDRCFAMACRADEREDRRNVYFERYDIR